VAACGAGLASPPSFRAPRRLMNRQHPYPLFPAHPLAEYCVAFA
jgi:hypothetical protein